MFDIIARVLAWYYDLWPSYGMAIVFLTLTVMVLVLPLTLKATRSMLMMQALQPEIKKLQQQHRDDKQKLNEEMLRLYRENKINPLSGCLPLLIQFPVFIVLYQVLNGLTRRASGTFDPKYLDHESALYQALDPSNTMVSWGIDLARSATQVASDDAPRSIPYVVLVLAVALTTYIQQKQISSRSPNAEMNPQQRMLLRIMPAFMAFISLSLPAALVLYFFVSNLFRVGQQGLISHTIYKPAHRDGLLPSAAKEPEAAADEPTAKPRPKSTKANKADAVETTATDGPSRPKDKSKSAETPAPAPQGFLGRLLGGLSGDASRGNGARDAKAQDAGRTKGGSGGRANSPTRPASGRVTPPSSGRVTPRGTRSGGGGAASRKKKRK